MNEYVKEYKNSIIKAAVVLFVVIIVFAVVSIAVKVKQYRFIGNTATPSATITVSGKGKLEKMPDTAKISFSVEEKSKNVSVAQDAVSKKVTAIKQAVIAAGIDEKYVSTEGYASYPNYDYPQVVCGIAGCPVKAPLLRDYTVSQTIKISVKDLTKVENVLDVLGKNNVTTISGPNFGFEDDKAVIREARDSAIADAQKEAKKLARALGVRLVRVVSFSDQSGGGYNTFDMYKTTGMSAAVSAAPALPTGVQSIESSVSVTYEIR